MKYNRSKFIDTNYIRQKLMSRRTLSIAGSHKSDNENSLKNNVLESDKNKKYLKV